MYPAGVIFDDVLLVWDYGHLSVEAAKLFAREYVYLNLKN